MFAVSRGDTVDDFERRNHLETLILTPARLKAALKGVPKKVLAYTPAPGKWSIQQILCHMRDMEAEAYLARYKRILGEDNPRLPDIDGDAIAIERDYPSQKPGEVLRDWVRLRKESLQILRKVRKDQWTRIGTHETTGVHTMEDFLRRHAVGNDDAHLHQIEAIKRRFDLLQRLEAGPASVADAVKGRDADTLRKRPAPDKWSALENACHIRDIERVYSSRFTMVAFGEKPKLWMLDNDKAAAAREYNEDDIAAVLKEWKRLRAETLTLLRALPDVAWQRTGHHPTRGEKTIEELANVLAGHDESHIARIRAMK
jgi:DinB superfamily